MRTHAFEKREDGSLITSSPIIVDSENIPEGLFLADPSKTYNEQGYEIEPPEPIPQEPTLEEKVAEHDTKIVTLEETIDVLYGGV